MFPEAIFTRLAGVLVALFMAIIIGFSTTHNSVSPSLGLAGAALDAANAELDAWGDVSASGNFDAKNSLNWHILCMTIAFPIAMAESVLAFRAPLFKSPLLSGVVWHLFWQTVSFGFAITAMVADVKNKLFITQNFFTVYNMYSTHSWCGALVLVLFALQYFSALVMFVLLKNQIAVEWRVKFGSWHATVGRLVVVGSLCTCIVGWQDYQSLHVLAAPNQANYNNTTALEAAVAIALAIQAASLFLFFTRDAKSGFKHENAGRTTEGKNVDLLNEGIVMADIALQSGAA